ncbi:hypothetical protein SDC9_46810 [bioreactor metagenome]|uniref:Uncharacterized protein n=1 Tax=bioreactor metagenome TaxID=1076179 RepID=A0A644WDD8_9ZZZZ
MERLTQHTPINFGYAEYELVRGADEQDVISRLGRYEDTGYTPEDFDRLCREMSQIRLSVGADTYEHLREIVYAYKDGYPPCKVGDVVYFIINDYCPMQQKRVKFVQSASIDSISFHKDWWCLNTHHRNYYKEDIGKTMFLTRKEAEIALKEVV